MSLRIDPDHRRFREIVRGKIKQNLRKYISQGRADRAQGQGPGLDPAAADRHPALPLRRARSRAASGRARARSATAVGQGEPSDDGTGQGRRQDPGEHALEVELSLDELAQILGEELELPRIEPKGKERIITQKDRYVGIRRTGPESLRHFKRTFRAGAAPADRDRAPTTRAARSSCPIREDTRYRSWKTDAAAAVATPSSST